MTNEQRYRIICWLTTMAERLDEEDPARTEVRALVVAMYEEMQAVYREAGQPFGPGGPAMFRWSQQGANSLKN